VSAHAEKTYSQLLELVLQGNSGSWSFIRVIALVPSHAACKANSSWLDDAGVGGRGPATDGDWSRSPTLSHGEEESICRLPSIDWPDNSLVGMDGD
jgi:hypothetical protein